MFALIDIIENYDWYHKLPNIEPFDLRYYVVRTSYVIFTLIMSISIPKLDLFMNFIGALAGTAA